MTPDKRPGGTFGITVPGATDCQSHEREARDIEGEQGLLTEGGCSVSASNEVVTEIVSSRLTLAVKYHAIVFNLSNSQYDHAATQTLTLSVSAPLASHYLLAYP